MRFSLPLLYLFFLLSPSSLYSQSSKLTASQSYDILWGEKPIGTFTAKQSIDDQKESYVFLAEVNFKVLWKKYRRVTRLTSNYIGDSLIFCSNSSRLNEEIKDSSWVRSSKGQYQIFNYPDEVSEISKPINFSIPHLYFKDPKEFDDSIFVEGHTEFMKFEKVDDSNFKLHFPGGNSNIYTYKNERLEKLYVDRSWFNLWFIRTD